jgi:hypothetical protein
MAGFAIVLAASVMARRLKLDGQRFDDPNDPIDPIRRAGSGKPVRTQCLKHVQQDAARMRHFHSRA